ncbi:MAG: GDSL-type esterase/lipase family protein [Methylococcales bacterium]|nr:GDSL-type esterase/lipase family protein [Methylococcales bacterium]
MRLNSSNKQWITAACVSLILLFLYGVITVQYKIPPFNAIKRFISPDYEVVFIGDSITNMASWQELFPSLKSANRGIPGDTAEGVLKRMDGIYSTNARKAFIMIGTNDIGIGTEVNDIVENYKKIISHLAAHGMQVYVQSTILAGNQKAERNKKIMALNNQLKKMADENNSFEYIDLNTGLTKDSVLEARYTPDGVHLNSSGYAVWKDMIKNYVK